MACPLGAAARGPTWARTGYESVRAQLNADNELKAKLEALRLATGRLMGLGDVANKTYPKMTLDSKAP